MHSIATGKHNGPAANAISESSLLASAEPEPLQTHAPQSPILTPEASIPLAYLAARGEIRKLLSESAGRHEEGTAHSRKQRRKLKQKLQDETQRDLDHWREAQPIISLLLTFTKSLLESGGLRLKILRFSSIHTYLTTVAQALITHGWDRDFMLMTATDYRDLYKGVESECKQKNTDWNLVLRMFHQHLRETISAPYLPELEYNNSRLQKNCRGSLITSGAIDAAEEMLTKCSRFDPDQKRAARTLMLLSIGYGARLRECAGIKAGDFDAIDRHHLTLKANVIRDMKNRKRGRIIPEALLKETQNRAIASQRSTASLSPDTEQFLLGSPERTKKIISIRHLTSAIITSLRSASQNDTAVFHDLRHTFATRLLLAGHPLQSRHPALVKVKERLAGSLPSNLETIRKITRTASGSPFFVDDVAQVLSHANSDTLLNVYFHGAPVLLADSAFIANSNIHIDDQRLAHMLGKDRTAVVKLRSRQANRHEGTDSASLVRHYLRRSSRNPLANQVIGDEDREKLQPIGIDNDLSAIMLDRFLCHRKQLGLSLKELSNLPEQYGISIESINNMLHRYRELVCDTGLDDFEPDNSELLGGAPTRSNGVLRSRKEREGLLHRIADLLRKNEHFSESFQVTIRAWATCIDGHKPMLVIRNTEDLECALYFLRTLGAKDEQLTFLFVGSVQSPLFTAVSQKGFQTNPLPSGRFSRGPKNVRVEELAILVSQLAGSSVPDGRDFHRVMAIASCAFLEPLHFTKKPR